MMTSIRDVEKKGRCVAANRVPCEKARKYLEKKGLLCGVPRPPPKPAPMKKKQKGFFEAWFG